MRASDLLSRIEIIGIPTRTNFRGVQIRELALIKGAKRWGEFGPFADYSLERDSLWLKATLEMANQDFPPPRHHQIPVNATLPEVPLDQVGEVLSWFPGSQTVKVKIGTADDEERISEVLQIIPDARLRLDANGLFTIAQAEEFLTRLYNKYGHQIEYVEQPCASLAENAAVQLPIPIAIDENLRLGDDISEINSVADIVVVKVAPVGGITRALSIIDRLDKPVVISSALESSVGMVAGIALAAHLPQEIICGLGTVALLASDVVVNPLLPVDGSVAVKPIEVSEELIEKYRLPQEQVSNWHNRIDSALQNLHAQQVREGLL